VFEEALSDAIDEVLKQIFSEKVRDSFLKYCEASFHVSKADLPNHVEGFLKALSDVFGSPAGLVLGKAIVKRLYMKLGLPFVDKNDRTLLDFLEEVNMRTQEMPVR
jgi:hypothetical protein